MPRKHRRSYSYRLPIYNLGVKRGGYSTLRPGRIAPWKETRYPLQDIELKFCFMVDCAWNVMAHAQRPNFVFRRNGRVHLNRRGASVQSTTGSRGVRISGSNAGYTMFRSSVKSTGFPLHSPVSPSLPLPCVTVCHHISTGLYNSLYRPV